MTAQQAPATAMGLDPIYQTRDDIARSLNPANAHERLLVSVIAQAWHRLQKALEMERRAFEQSDPLDLIDNNPTKFKTVTRYVADCERLYRRANEEFRRAQRLRKSAERHLPHRSRRPQPPDRDPQIIVMPENPLASDPTTAMPAASPIPSGITAATEPSRRPSQSTRAARATQPSQSDPLAKLRTRRSTPIPTRHNLASRPAPSQSPKLDATNTAPFHRAGHTDSAH